MAVLPWKILSSRYLIRDEWMTLRADRCETSDGVILDPYYIQEGPDWVHVAAFNTEGELLIIWQYRHGSGVVGPELPCGCVDPGESPLQAVQRELLEETGCTAFEYTMFP